MCRLTPPLSHEWHTLDLFQTMIIVTVYLMSQLKNFVHIVLAISTALDNLSKLVPEIDTEFSFPPALPFIVLDIACSHSLAFNPIAIAPLKI